MSVHYLYKKTTGRTALVPIDTETIATVLDKLRMTGGSYTLTIQSASLAGDMTITLPGADGTAGQVIQTNGSNVWSWTDKSGAASAVTEAFKTIACPAGTNPVADNATDTLTFAAGSGKITITGASAADSVTFDIVNGQIDHDALLNFVANKHIDWTGAAANFDTSGTVAGSQLISDVADGTPPLTVVSTTAVTNLNADTVDARHASYFATAGHTHLDLVSGNVPIGSVLAWVPGYFANGSNGTYTRVLGDANTVAGANVYLNPLGFWVCLSEDSEVLMGDGNVRPIGEIVNNKISDCVLAYDNESGEFKKAKIVGWSKLPASQDDWMKIRIRRGNGRARRTLDLTREHPVLTQRGWVKAGELATEDKVYRYENTLSPQGRQALLGTFLGDGSLTTKGHFQIVHGMPQEEYALFLSDKFGAKPGYYTKSSGISKGRTYIHTSFSMKTFCPDIAHVSGSHKATRKVLAGLGDIGLAFWYMDDGSLSKDRRCPNYFRANFHTEGYCNEELENIQAYFLGIGIETVLYKVKNCNGKVLCVDRKSNDLFFKKIAKYVHPSLAYKIPPQYQEEFCLSNVPFVEKGRVIYGLEKRPLSSYAKSKRNLGKYKFKYDIEVKGLHSFIANGFIVHNCDGSALNDAASPIWVGAGRYLPNLTDSRFLMGYTEVGGIGGSSTMAHTHGYGTIAAANEAAHTHAVSGTSAGGSSHSHGYGTIAAANESAHTHADGSLAAANESAHTHSVDPPNTTSGINSGGYYYTDGAGLYQCARTSHTHATDIGAFDSAAGSAHTHAISGTTAAGSAHAHAISGSTATETSHAHGVSITSGAGAAHTHTISGDTGAASNTACLPVYLGVLYIIRCK